MERLSEDLQNTEEETSRIEYQEEQQRIERAKQDVRKRGVLALKGPAVAATHAHANKDHSPAPSLPPDDTFSEVEGQPVSALVHSMEAQFEDLGEDDLDLGVEEVSLPVVDEAGLGAPKLTLEEMDAFFSRTDSSPQSLSPPPVSSH